MQIACPSPAEHAAFRDLVNAEIRPGKGETRAWDDFPVILGEENRSWTLVARAPDGRLAAGLACLVRSFTTSLGILPIGGVGGVVTAQEFRGQGLSRRLQEAMLAHLHRHNVPLAVLWSDQPEIYAGRGFGPAGWEHHLLLEHVDLPVIDGAREYRPEDAEAVEELYASHPWRTVREPGDSRLLYGMPGTRGLVVADGDDRPVAAIFCGKGADFSGYVTEWSGEPWPVLGLFREARERGWASHVLVPPGGEKLLNAAAERGGRWFASVSGLWAVLDDRALRKAAEAADLAVPEDMVPAAWLGGVGDDGCSRPGLLHVAVWGFDSV
ncbi:MAG: GNAT family N-acetyltransferase [bacterium]|nr:GNAT family N-acetyltransferase [bacterium]